MTYVAKLDPQSLSRWIVHFRGRASLEMIEAEGIHDIDPLELPPQALSEGPNWIRRNQPCNSSIDRSSGVGANFASGASTPMRRPVVLQLRN